MKELIYVSKLMGKVEKEVEVLSKEGSTDTYVFICNMLLHLISNGCFDGIDNVLKKKTPLQFVYNYFNTLPCRKIFFDNAKEMYEQSCLAIKGEYKEREDIYIGDIDDTYYFYFDVDNGQEDNMCFGAIIDKDTDKEVYDFECSYDDFYHDTSIIEKLALFMYLVSDEFKEIK